LIAVSLSTPCPNHTCERARGKGRAPLNVNVRRCAIHRVTGLSGLRESAELPTEVKEVLAVFAGRRIAVAACNGTT
jgi:hypothetical protein